MDVPFFSRRHASHAVQPVQNRLQACQDGSVEADGEGTLEARLVLGLRQQALEFNQLDLKMELPVGSGD